MNYDKTGMHAYNDKKTRLLIQSEFDRSGQIVSRSFDYTEKENPSLEHQTYHGGRPIFTYVHFDLTSTQCVEILSDWVFLFSIR